MKNTGLLFIILGLCMGIVGGLLLVHGLFTEATLNPESTVFQQLVCVIRASTGVIVYVLAMVVCALGVLIRKS